MKKKTSVKKTNNRNGLPSWLSVKALAVFVFAFAFGAIGATLLNTSFAARNIVSMGSCSAAPNPVAVGAGYTLTGTDLGANTLVNVLISDSQATAAWNLQADANGTVTLNTSSYWAGTTNVKFQVNNKHRFTQVASCSFTVI